MNRFLALAVSILLLSGCATTRLEDTGSATGLGASPFSTGGTFTAAQANAINDAVNDNDTRLDTLEAISGLIFSDADGTYTTITGVSAAEVGYLSGVTSDIQTQINAKVSTESINTEAELESVSNTQIATETEAQGYVTYEQLNTNSDIDTDLSDGGTASTVPSSAATATALGLKATKAGDTYTGAHDFSGATMELPIADVSLASDLDYEAISFLDVIAGEAITAGYPVYAKYDAVQEVLALYLYDADLADADDYYMLGIATESGAAGASITVWVGHCLLMRRDALEFATAAWGKPLYSTTTAGGISSTAPAVSGDHVIRVGTAVAADYVLYRFQTLDVKVP